MCINMCINMCIHIHIHITQTHDLLQEYEFLSNCHPLSTQSQSQSSPSDHHLPSPPYKNIPLTFLLSLKLSFSLFLYISSFVTFTFFFFFLKLLLLVLYFKNFTILCVFCCFFFASYANLAGYNSGPIILCKKSIIPTAITILPYLKVAPR
jgi:hypothetical protein